MKATRLVVGLLVALMIGSVEGLKVGFYSGTACSEVEKVVRDEVEKEFANNPSIVALLLRMYFHDCFADGKCDASLLITENKGLNKILPTELSASPNQGIRRLDFIDKLKETVENHACNKTDLVSCADIIALATRDAISLASKRAPYAVPTGRSDGCLSLAVNGNALPSPGSPVALIVEQFETRGFTANETVILSGAHTVGEARCKFFDPNTAENTTTRAALRSACQAGGEKRAFLDQGAGSAFRVDKSYFAMVEQGSGVLQSDRGLKNENQTKAIVSMLANRSEDEFLTLFEAALIKLGNLGSDLIGSKAERIVRKVCSKVS